MLEQRDPSARGSQPDVGGFCGLGQAAQFGGPHEQREGIDVR